MKRLKNRETTSERTSTGGKLVPRSAIEPSITEITCFVLAQRWLAYTATTRLKLCIPKLKPPAAVSPLMVPAQLHVDFRYRTIPSRECILVRHDVRWQDSVSDSESNQPLLNQFPDAAGPEEELRRLTDNLYSEGCSRWRQKSQLAPGSRRPDILGHALVLAEGHTAVGTSTRVGDMAASSNSGCSVKAASFRCATAKWTKVLVNAA